MQAGDEGSNYYGPIQDFNFNGTWDLGDSKQLDLSLGYYNEHTKANQQINIHHQVFLKPAKIKKNGMIINVMIIAQAIVEKLIIVII